MNNGNVLSEIYLSDNFDIYYNQMVNLFSTEELTGINLPGFTTDTISGLLTSENTINKEYDINYLKLNSNVNEQQGFKILNSTIQNVLYNNVPELNFSNSTLVAWVKDSNEINTFTAGFTNPLFSNYSNDNMNEQQNNGIMFGPYGVYTHNFDTEYGNYTFESDYATDLKHSYINKWIMYVFEFQHTNADIVTAATYERGNYTEGTGNIYRDSNLSPGKMRINIYAYYTKEVTASKYEFAHTMLLPTKAMRANKDLLASYSIPVLNSPYNPLFVGTCPVQDYVSNVLNWYSWNGGIRNIMLFDKFLTDAEIGTLYKSGINKRYNWNYTGENFDLAVTAKEQSIALAKFNNLSNMDVTYCKSTQSMTEFTDTTKEKFFNV